MTKSGARDFASVVALALLGCAPRGLPPASPSPLLGGALPDLRRPAVSGGSVDTRALRGRPVVVKFFAKYCVPCLHTLPAVEALHREEPGVHFVGVSEDESEADAAELVRRFELGFPVVMDPGHVLSGRFRVGELPAVFVADARGQVRWVGGPDQGEEALRDAVRAVASE